MKFYDIVSMAFKEMKSGKGMLIPALLVLSIMTAVSIILLNISQGAMEVIYSQFNTNAFAETDIYLYGVEAEDIDAIRSSGAEDMEVSFASLVIDRMTLKDRNGKTIEADPYIVWHGGKNKDLINFSASDNFDNENKVYIVYPKAREKRYKDIETVTVYHDKTKAKCTLEVADNLTEDFIVEEERDDLEKALVYIPIKAISEAYRDEGIYPSLNVTIHPKGIEEFSKIKRKLTESGYVVWSDIDTLADIISMMNLIFKSMAAAVILLGVASMITLCNMYFSSRQRHIILMKTLGMSSGNLFSVLFLIIVLMVTLSTIAGMVMVFFGNNHIYNVLSSVFGDFNYESSNTLVSGLTAFASALAISAVSSLGMYKKTKNSDIVTLLNRND